jgi:hypothetical protein
LSGLGSSELFGSFPNITANTLSKLEALINDAKVENLIESKSCVNIKIVIESQSLHLTMYVVSTASLEGRELYDKIHTVLTQLKVRFLLFLFLELHEI